MKAVVYKRILAYLIDIMVVSILASFLTFFIPVSEKYQKAYLPFKIDDIIEFYYNTSDVFANLIIIHQIYIVNIQLKFRYLAQKYAYTSYETTYLFMHFGQKLLNIWRNEKIPWF